MDAMTPERAPTTLSSSMLHGVDRFSVKQWHQGLKDSNLTYKAFSAMMMV
jgi:hypothetical protein